MTENGALVVWYWCENWSTWRKTCPCANFLLHKPNVDWPWIVPSSLWWEARK